MDAAPALGDVQAGLGQAHAKQKKIFEEAAEKSDAFFLTIQREATTKMADAYVKAGGTAREMTKQEFDAWVALAKKTAYPEYAKISPTAKGLNGRTAQGICQEVMI